MEAPAAALEVRPVTVGHTLPEAPAALSRASQAVTLWLIVVLAAILFSGRLFGYDQGVISDALREIKATFSLSALLVEVVTSWVTLGVLFGSLAGGSWRTGSRASTPC